MTKKHLGLLMLLSAVGYGAWYLYQGKKQQAFLDQVKKQVAENTDEVLPGLTETMVA